ncbi:MAG: ABC transporter ATP-binding protein/permease [Aerococcus sp.]|nr:ABC transporter ATP-binding protein/permease [Aerococcus sp.]
MPDQKKGFFYLWGRLWTYIKPYRGKFFFSLFSIVVMTLCSGIQPIVLAMATNELTRNVVDMAKGVAGAGINFPRIGQITILYILVSAVYVGGHLIGQLMMTNVIQHAMTDLRNAISQKTNRIPVAYFDRFKLGDILSRTTNDVDSVANALQQAIIQGLISFLTFLFSFIGLLVLSLKMSVIVIITLIIEVFAIRALTKLAQPVFKKMQNTLGDLFSVIEEQLSGHIEIRAYNHQEASIKEFSEQNNKLQRYGVRSNFLSSITQPVSNFIFNMAYVTSTLIGGLRVLAGTFSVGSLQAFVIYITQMNGPLNGFTQMLGMIQSATSATERIFEYLDQDEEVQTATDEHLPEPLRGAVEFDHIKFGYDPDNILMNDISFKVKPGQTVAVVGPTGAGKTTLINLLMRFYDVLDGAIKIDGVNIKDISRHDLRQHMGMVLQDAWLYTDTVMENIRFGNLDARDYEVVDAAKVANVHEFITTLPNTYHMEINEEGTNVSQGQKQLMTIARAVISDPDILILDEATSSVDTRLEKLIQEAMDRVMENRTSFVIAHRLSTIKNADMILVMQNGTITEHGTHDELMAADGFYAELYNSQFAHSDPADIHMSY